METNYMCPTVVQHSSNNNNSYVHLNDCDLQTNPSTTIIQTPQTTKLSRKTFFFKRLTFYFFVLDNDDGATTQQQSTKQNFANFANTDLNGKTIRTSGDCIQL